MVEKHDRDIVNIQKSLNYSIKDGLWCAIMTGFGDSYLQAFAVFLHASAQQMGLLASLPQFMAAIAQLFSVRLSYLFDSPKKTVILFVFFQAFMWAVITVISYLTGSVWVLILLVMLYQSFGAIPNPIWFSWMGNLVPETQRGKYFGRRNRISGFFTFSSIIVAGIILDKISETHTFLAFGLLFCVAFVSRMISVTYLVRQYEPPVERKRYEPNRFIEFLSRIGKTNFGKFALYTALLNIAVFIASPLFTLYWLKYLNFSYLQYMAVVGAASIASFVTMTTWGRHSDHYGNKTVLEAASYIIASLPFLWYLVRFVPQYLQFPMSVAVQSISGFAWAGFNLSSSNFIYDTIAPAERVQMFSYYNVMKGLSVFVGGILGGFLASFGDVSTPVTFFTPKGIMLVILLSGITRYLVVAILLPKILEVRSSVKPKPHFLYFVTVMPFKGLVYELAIGVNRTLGRKNQKL